VTLCGLKVWYQHFKGTYCLHHLSKRMFVQNGGTYLQVYMVSNQEDHHGHLQCHENLKSHSLNCVNTANLVVRIANIYKICFTYFSTETPQLLTKICICGAGLLCGSPRSSFCPYITQSQISAILQKTTCKTTSRLEMLFMYVPQ
jgi:hypothetical protein